MLFTSRRSHAVKGAGSAKGNVGGRRGRGPDNDFRKWDYCDASNPQFLIPERLRDDDGRRWGGHIAFTELGLIEFSGKS